MANIGVKPMRKGMGLVHPLDGPLPDEGGQWREDQFTLKRLRDRDIKRVSDDDGADEADAKPPAKKAADAAPPEPAEAPVPTVIEPVTDAAALPASAPAQE